METRPELIALLEKAKNHVMTPEERIAQRRSWVRGEMMLAHGDMTAAEVSALIDRVLPELRVCPVPPPYSDRCTCPEHRTPNTPANGEAE